MAEEYDDQEMDALDDDRMDEDQTAAVRPAGKKKKKKQQQQPAIAAQAIPVAAAAPAPVEAAEAQEEEEEEEGDDAPSPEDEAEDAKLSKKDRKRLKKQRQFERRVEAVKSQQRGKVIAAVAAMLPTAADGGAAAAAAAAAAAGPEEPGRPIDPKVVAQFGPEYAPLFEYIERLDANRIRIKKGLVPNMRTDGIVYASDDLLHLLLEELMSSASGGMMPALRQVANVAGLPGIVGHSLAMPDIHCGYGFAIGNVAAVDMDDPAAVVSPGGVGFDINCGVRLLRTNLTEADIPAGAIREQLAKAVFDCVPAGVGSSAGYDMSMNDLRDVLRDGMRYLVGRGLAWEEDMAHCEEGGVMPGADPAAVSDRAKKRGLHQLGTLGSGNHYAEVQVIDEIYDPVAAAAMGLTRVGQVCVMIHSGSRGLGHQVCTDYLQMMEKAGACSGLNDRQLAAVSVNSLTGRNYLAAMAAASNFAFCNRTLMAMRVREAFHTVFRTTPRKLDMHVVYDVCHNIAKIEQHVVNGASRRVLVHRKGATRAFGPGHPCIPADYREIGQPVLIGGSMGTRSYVLTGTEEAMRSTFGSTCHGAGRVLGRGQAKREISATSVLRDLAAQGIAVRVTSKAGIAEEAADAYKDVDQVVGTCHAAGISRMVVRLRPIIVIKG